MVFNIDTVLPDNSILITANMQSETGFPSSHQLKSYVASKSRLKLAARAVLSADAGLLVIPRERTILIVFCHPTVVGGRRHLPPKMGDRSDPPPSKIAHVDRFPPVTSQVRIYRKRCKIGGKLVLITNRKSYMSFRLVQKSVTLNDLGRRNSVILRYFSEFG